MPEDSVRKRKIGPDARTEALRLLVEGLPAVEVARRLGVREPTVSEWRNSPEGQRFLEEARKAHAETFSAAMQDAYRVLRESAAKAAQRLVEALDSRSPRVRRRAAERILHRVWLPDGCSSRANGERHSHG